MGDIGWELVRRVVDMVKGGTSIWPRRPAANRGIRRGGRPTGGWNIEPDDDAEVVVGAGVGVGVGFGSALTDATGNSKPYSHTAHSA